MARNRTSLFRIIFVLAFGLLAIFFIATPESGGEEHVVDVNGNGDFTTITAAIENSTSGDTIYVWDGTYNEAVNIDVAVSVIGNGSKNTIIDGGGTGDVGSC